MFYIYRTRRESRGAVEVWVDVDGRGESGSQGGAALAGELEGGAGDRDPQQHFGASNWMEESFNFFCCNITLKLHLGVLNPKLGHMKETVVGVKRFLEKDFCLQELVSAFLSENRTADKTFE